MKPINPSRIRFIRLQKVFAFKAETSLQREDINLPIPNAGSERSEFFQ